MLHKKGNERDGESRKVVENGRGETLWAMISQFNIIIATIIILMPFTQQLHKNNQRRKSEKEQWKVPREGGKRIRICTPNWSNYRESPAGKLYIKPSLDSSHKSEALFLACAGAKRMEKAQGRKSKGREKKRDGFFKKKIYIYMS